MNPGAGVILHVLPADGIGGVEIAARRAASRLFGRLVVLFLSGGTQGGCDPHVIHQDVRSAFSLAAIRGALQTARSLKPSVVVSSLWRSFLVFLVLRIALRDTKFVFFLHSDRDTHPLDWLATRVMAFLCDEVWADSEQTLQNRLRSNRRRPRRVISFVPDQIAAIARDVVKPIFIYWGRLDRLKGLDRALALFADIAERHPDAQLTIIGPDAGCLTALRKQVAALKIAKRVRFSGPMAITEILEVAGQACFYLQLSRQEGMALSVVEAMQTGLVPIVTPVGEMGRYVRHLENGIIHTDTNTSVECVEQVLFDPSLFRQLSQAASRQWQAATPYHSDFAAAADELVGGTGS